MPAFRGDVGVKNGKIAEIGKLRGPAEQVDRRRRAGRRAGLYRQSLPLRRAGHLGPALLVLAATTARPSVVIGNCSLSLAPVRKGNATRMAEFLSYVEAIPMEVLNTIEVDWETFPQYMDRLDRNLGVNVGTLIGHTAVRYYVMGDECQKRDRDRRRNQGDAAGRARRHGRRRARPVGVAQQGPLRPAGRPYPGAVGRREGDFRARRRAARNGHRHHPVGRRPRCRDEGRADGAPVGSDRPSRHLQQSRPERAPSRRLAEAHGAGRRDRGAGHPRLSAVPPEPTTQSFKMANMQVFRGSPTWHPILLASDEEKLRAYADPAVRQKLHEEMVESKVEIPGNTIARDWYNYIWVEEPKLEKNQGMTGQDHRPDRQGAGQAHHRRLPRSGRRGKARNRASCRPRTTSTPRRCARS